MTISRCLAFFAMLILGVCCSSDASAITIAVDATSGGGTATLTAFRRTEGWSFTVNSPITVDALGVWDDGSDGLNASHAVGLWDTTQTLLRSATVGNTSAVVASAHSGGRWLLEGINPILLSVGQYVIGADFDQAQPMVDLLLSSNGLGVNNLQIAVLPQVTFGGNLFSGITSGLTYPSNSLNNSYDPGYFGPTFSIVIPEPTTFSLLLVCAFCSLTRHRRRSMPVLSSSHASNFTPCASGSYRYAPASETSAHRRSQCG